MWVIGRQDVSEKGLFDCIVEYVVSRRVRKFSVNFKF